MAKAEILKPFILDSEGGYGVDNGGPTCKGVTLDTFRSVFGRNKTVADLRGITDAEWMAVFRRLFWDRCKGDMIEDQSVANMIVDWTWNSGAWGIRNAQRIAGVAADGTVGGKTLAAWNGGDARGLFERLRRGRLDYLGRICRNDRSPAVRENGLKRRVRRILYGKLLAADGSVIWKEEA